MGERGAVEGQLVPRHAAVVRQHAQDRVAEAQVVVRRARGPQRQRRAALAQHVETRAVVDLTVTQQHARDARVTHGAGGLQRGAALELRQDVR